MEPQGKIQNISLNSVRIEVLSENTKQNLGWASGSFCTYKKQIFLVTNWHVVSGRNFQTNNPIHHSGAIPGFLNLEFHVIRNASDKTFYHDECEINDVELFNDFKPTYKIHPVFGSKIDIAILNLTSIFELHSDVKILGYDLEKLNPIELHAMDDVFVVGFPLMSNTTPNKYPIYKNATIASEPDAFESELPIFYVDGKTKSGMSGSPVVKRSRLNIEKMNNQDALIKPEQITFIGVYSGRERQEDDEYQAELGIVWRVQECILPIIEKAIN